MIEKKLAVSIRLLLVAAVLSMNVTLALAQGGLAQDAANVGRLFPVDYYDGLRAWDAGRQDVAVALWVDAAQLGDVQAMYELGSLYARGKGTERSDTLAAYYFLLAERFGKVGSGPAFERVTATYGDLVVAEVEAFVPARLQAPVPMMTNGSAQR